jgi:hypothetical protein
MRTVHRFLPEALLPLAKEASREYRRPTSSLGIFVEESQQESDGASYEGNRRAFPKLGGIRDGRSTRKTGLMKGTVRSLGLKAR